MKEKKQSLKSKVTYVKKINYTFAYTCNADRCGRLWKAAELKC